MISGGSCTRWLTGGAVGVDDETTGTADDVVMVVPRLKLVLRQTTIDGEPPEQPSVAEGMEDVVDGLLGDSAQTFAHMLRDGVGRGVGMLCDDAESRNSSRGDTQASSPEGSSVLLRVIHDSILALFLTKSRIWPTILSDETQSDSACTGVP